MSRPAALTQASGSNVPGSDVPSVAASPSFRSFLARQAGLSVGDAYTNRQEGAYPRNGGWGSATSAPLLGMINHTGESHRKEKG